MLLNLRDFEASAREALDPVYFDYVAGGARDEVTVRANVAAFRQLSLLPRVLRGREKRELDISLFGSRASMPVLLSPTAFHRLAHPEGELATARAAAAAGAIMIVSMASTVAVEEVAAAARAAAPDRPTALWFQLYLQPDLEFTEALVRRATEAGCTALVVVWLIEMPATPVESGAVVAAGVTLEEPPPRTAYATAASRATPSTITARRRRTSSRSSLTELRKAFMGSPGRSRERLARSTWRASRQGWQPGSPTRPPGRSSLPRR